MISIPDLKLKFISVFRLVHNIGKIVEQSSTQSKSIEEKFTYKGSEVVNKMKQHRRSKDNFQQRDFRTIKKRKINKTLFFTLPS